LFNPQEFRQYAEQCRQLAKDGDVAAHRDTLHKMAETWCQLAVEEERIADLVREADSLFSARGAGPNAWHLWPTWGTSSRLH
jgi:hypothetical protein